MAAVLACGDGAVLSHGSAAAHWGLLRPFDGPVDVSVPTHGGRRRRPGIRLHRCASLGTVHGPGKRFVTRLRDIPVTTPARTIADLPAVVQPQLVRRATRQAEVLGLPLGDGIATDRTRSDLERDFLRLCRRHGLPRPEVNVRIGRWIVDFLWRRERLVVETDSYRWHRGDGRLRGRSRPRPRPEARGLLGAPLHRKSGSRATRPRLRPTWLTRSAARRRVAPMADKPPELFLIDGNSLAYRAFFALPESIATADGRPTNAIYGLASMLVKIIDEHHPGGVVVAWDAGMSGREVTYDLYKAQRSSRPDLLREQWPHLMPLVAAFGYTNVKVEGFEADDVIATLAVRAREEGIPVMVVTGDRDAYQLVGDGIRVMSTTQRDHRDQDLRQRRRCSSATGCRPSGSPT